MKTKNSTNTSAIEQLAALDERVAQLQAEERDVARREAELRAAERAASERLVVALAEDGDGKAQRTELERARADADQPWNELRQAHGRKVEAAKQDRRAFITENIDRLLAEHAAEARARHAALVDALDAVPRAHEALVRFIGKVNALGTIARGPSFKLPEPAIGDVLSYISWAPEIPVPLPGPQPADPTIRSVA